MLDELLLKIKSYNPNSDLEKISKAYNFTKECHEGQFRNSGEPYFIHPVAVANILADLYMDDATIIAGLMHDILEDTEVTFKEMAEMFDEEIANLVNGVTKLKKIKYQSKQESQADNLRKMLLAMNSDIRAISLMLLRLPVNSVWGRTVPIRYCRQPSLNWPIYCLLKMP